MSKISTVDSKITSTSPVPSIQISDRESHGEQISLKLQKLTVLPAGPQKRKKHWRSPSNPIDFMNSISDQQDMMVSNNRADCCTPCGGTTSKTLQLNLNFDLPNKTIGATNLKNFCPAKTEEQDEKGTMTVITRTLKHSKPSPLLSYENLLLRCPSETSNQKQFLMLAELSISPIVSTVSSDYSSTRRHIFAFESTYCKTDFDISSSSTSFDSTSLAYGHIDPIRSEELYTLNPNIHIPATTTAKKLKVSFSRCSLLQVILRNPEDNSVAGIFVIKLDLSDMPPDSRTILRQKAYKSKSLADDQRDHLDKASDYLVKFIELPLKRLYDPEANRQRIILSGPIRVAFSFNRSNLRFTSPRRSDSSAVEAVQKSRTILQFPSIYQKYFPIDSVPAQERQRSNSLNTENINRSFQHGSLCL